MKRIVSTLIAAAILIACNPATRPSVNVKIQVDPVDAKSTGNDDTSTSTSTGNDSTAEPNMSADLGVKTTIGPAVSVEVREPKK